ncbi:hypothetical protein A3C87_00400 [Candidatus Kaiserbacteria bacterium RIFCSPHIGHO2_02_FULL_49_34]|uniref:HEPN AbiU2-like domain-containing protein n=1 Tax=Candidatus Kaiserbacteria bacterium RIFCSPHIGHO2_02_FULL_49_34 TaxID=1798491 RepID=A0A1F6DKA0_9BACT|nr:MAG: hypothetical protein A3C87_00400 [Candidatus Kaiserbacteria bacterium RIFCSPHIGHO2_02_FULL_49_34]
MSYTVTPTFIDIFKIGDNIIYNIGILDKLYEQYNTDPSSRQYIRKIIVVTNASIAEALLFDFIRNRVQHANFTEQILLHIPAIFSVKLSKFQHYIAQARKHNLFNSTDAFYDALELLAKKRNRIHIQNDKFEEPRDEMSVFDENAKILSEKVIEQVCNVLMSKYPRRAEYHGYVGDFVFPWDAHLVAP